LEGISRKPRIDDDLRGDSSLSISSGFNLEEDANGIEGAAVLAKQFYKQAAQGDVNTPRWG
jgi:hypothetical protein